MGQSMSCKDSRHSERTDPNLNQPSQMRPSELGFRPEHDNPDTFFVDRDPMSSEKVKEPSPRPAFEDIYVSDDSEDFFEAKFIDNHVRLTQEDTVILLSYRLPVKIVRKEDGSFKIEESCSPVYPAIFKLKNQGLNFWWLGWPGIFPKNEDEKQRIT